MRDFLEEYGGFAVISFLMLIAFSLLIGKPAMIFYILSIIGIVLFISWIFWNYRYTVQVLKIWFGKIHVQTRQRISIEPQYSTKSKCPNPDILKRIQQIDEKLAQGMQMTGISNSQWQNVVQPNLMQIINKKELNEKNKNEILDILNQVEESIKLEEKEDIETEATLTAIRTFLSINGCSKE